MTNPWLKKNPFMSLWLSTANRVAGTLRGQFKAEARRQVKAAVAEALSPPARKTRAPAPKARPARKR